MGNVAAIFGDNWNNGVNSGSRASNWNNYPWNSNNNISGRGVCEDKLWSFLKLRHGYGLTGRPVQMWSAMWSCFGKYLTRSGTTPSSRQANGAPSIYYA